MFMSEYSTSSALLLLKEHPPPTPRTADILIGCPHNVSGIGATSNTYQVARVQRQQSRAPIPDSPIRKLRNYIGTLLYMNINTYWYPFFCSSHLSCSPFCSFSFLRRINSHNSDPGSHSRLFSPLPTTVRAFHFCREMASALSSLVDLRRITPTHARHSQPFALFIFAK